MFRPISSTDQDLHVWLDVLLGALDRIDAHGHVVLTAREVARLHAAGWLAILAPGRWPIPRLPLDWLGGHPELADLARLQHGPHALDPPVPPAPCCRDHGHDANHAGPAA